MKRLTVAAVVVAAAVALVLAVVTAVVQGARVRELTGQLHAARGVAKLRATVDWLDGRVNGLSRQVYAQEGKNLDVARVIAQAEDAVYTVVGQQVTGTAFAIAGVKGGGTWPATNYHVIDQPGALHIT